MMIANLGRPIFGRLLEIGQLRSFGSSLLAPIMERHISATFASSDLRRPEAQWGKNYFQQCGIAFGRVERHDHALAASGMLFKIGGARKIFYSR
jgi:hypothetical protein